MIDEDSENSTELNVSEKLENSVNSDIIPIIPKDIIYPNELNTFLREQLRFYVQKNGILQQNLSDLEFRYNASKENLEKLEQKIDTYEKYGDKTKFVPSSQLATTKIVELSKKLREKTSEVESLKTKCSKIEKQAFEFKQQVEKEQPMNEKELSSHEVPPNSLTEDETKKYNEKVTSLMSKLSETNNLNLQLKNEVKLAKKIIQQEIGDSFENLQSLTNLNGWRGRAQHIIDLQQKNAELKEKLKTAQSNNPVEVISATPIKTDNQLAALTKQNEELKNKYEELKKKHDTLKARHKVVDIDYTLLKSKSTMLKEQATRDQEIIATLLGQLNTSKETKNDILSQKERSITKLQTDKKQLIQEIEEYKSLIKKLRDDLNEKKTENKLAVSGDSSKVEVSQPSLTHKRLLELIESGNQKLQAEREAHAKTQSLLRAEKQKVIKSEAALARMDLENTTRSSYSSTSSLRPLDTTLKDQLELTEEQLKALQTRLEIEQMERKNDIQQFGQILKTYETKETLF